MSEGDVQADPKRHGNGFICSPSRGSMVIVLAKVRPKDVFMTFLSQIEKISSEELQ